MNTSIRHSSDAQDPITDTLAYWADKLDAEDERRYQLGNVFIYLNSDQTSDLIRALREAVDVLRATRSAPRATSSANTAGPSAPTPTADTSPAASITHRAPAEPLGLLDLQQVWQQAEAQQKQWRTTGELSLLKKMHDAFEGLKANGWKEAIYCPKDGSPFLGIEAGSTGVFRCHYDGDWPNGLWWAEDNGDLWPSNPVLWKPIPADSLAQAPATDQPDQTP